MENYFEQSEFSKMPDQQRVEALNANCESVVNDFVYTRPLTRGEIEAKNADINQALEEIERLKEERKELGKAISEQTEIVKENHKDVINKSVRITERIWYVNDFTTGHLLKINKDGEIIEKTRLKGGAQMNIFNSKQEAV